MFTSDEDLQNHQAWLDDDLKTLLADMVKLVSKHCSLCPSVGEPLTDAEGVNLEANLWELLTDDTLSKRITQVQNKLSGEGYDNSLYRSRFHRAFGTMKAAA